MSEVVHAEDEILGKAYDARLMRRIFRYLKPYWRLLLLSLLFLALYSGTQLLGPYITKVAIDRYIANQDLHGLDQVAWLYLGNVLLGQRAMHDLRTEIFTHLQKQDLAYFDRNPVGRLMTRTINDVETLEELFSTGIIGLLGDLCIVFGIAGAMLLLNWKLGLVTLTGFPLILYVSRFYRRRAREVYRESRLVLAKLNAKLQENIAGIATIQAFGQEERSYQQVDAVNRSYRNILLRSIHNNAMFFPIIEVFSALTIGTTLWYDGSLILNQALEADVMVACGKI